MTRSRRVAEERLIKLAYAAMHDASLWRKFLVDLVGLLGGDSGTVISPTSRRRIGAPFILHNVDVTPILSGLPSHVARAPFFDRALELGIIPGVFANLDVVPLEEIRETEYYRKVLQPMGIVDTIQIVVRVPDEGAEAGLVFSVARLRGKPRFSKADMDAARRVFPHLLRTTGAAFRYEPPKPPPPSLAQAFNGFSTACIVYAQGATPLVVNAAAERLLRDGDGVRRRQQGRGWQLESRDAAVTRELNTAIAHACDDAANRAVVEIAIPRSAGRAPLLAAIVPLGDDDPSFDWSGSARAAIYFIDVDGAASAGDGARPARRAQVLYGLTEAEAVVLRMYLDGKALRQIARERGVGLTTVQTQIKNIRLKTQSRSQRDLLRLGRLNDGAEGTDTLPRAAPKPPARKRKSPKTKPKPES